MKHVDIHDPVTGSVTRVKHLMYIVLDCLVTVAERLLANQMVKIAGHELLVTKEKPPQTNTADDFANDSMEDSSGEAYSTVVRLESSETDDEVLARTVFIENVPVDMCEFLEVVIENTSSGGGPVEMFEPDQARGGVLVRFVDQQGS